MAELNLNGTKVNFIVQSDSDKYGIGIDAIRDEVSSLLKQSEDANETKGLFLVKPANKWMEESKKRPIPQVLYSELWYEGELCILYSDTNQGKSILGVQIGDSITKGIAISGFKMEAKKQPVLYFDFELSEKQFEARYSLDFNNHYIFDDLFFRIEINPDTVIPNNQAFEDYLNISLERTIVETRVKVLIVDNITYLKNDTEKAKDALPLMKRLKDLKKKYGLSILALAHTPKRDLSKPITKNDLSGSKMLINFCDSAFAIGESTLDGRIKYIKQIKARYTEIIYNSDNVLICQIDKPFNFLQFEFVNFGKEWEHLKQHTEKDNESLNERVNELKQKGQSLREIGAELGISHMKVSRILKDCNNV